MKKSIHAADYLDRARVRFWAKVQKGPGCWIWLGARSVSKYGTFSMYRHNINAHRAAWILTYGPIEGKGIDALHTCHNGHLGCVRPSHLYLGTDQDNTNDKRAAGTLTCGERNHSAKLTEAQVREIRKIAKRGPGGNVAALARQYGVNKNTLWAAAIGRTWRHL